MINVVLKMISLFFPEKEDVKPFRQLSGNKTNDFKQCRVVYLKTLLINSGNTSADDSVLPGSEVCLLFLNLRRRF